ncbi:hypothetical protein SK3146_06976 [Paenibacillus konkukensis]|uniref:Uncharacterized protein n=2 Tax=Paenibacillus TaxID=44249 RepID=A0ABY4S3L2_9BACL|nr:hypothetical protein [Paenibacillus konkukensis]UQZ87674.1 hypothetical protein SK3146_06976 [Paenibacillus konkukensis]
MDSEEIQRLEDQFDRELTEGEAAEIKNTPVVNHAEEHSDTDWSLDKNLTLGSIARQNGRI